MCGVPHHLLDVFEPNEQVTVKLYQKMAVDIIENLSNQSIIPVIVGGTHYYMEAILFQKSPIVSSNTSTISTNDLSNNNNDNNVDSNNNNNNNNDNNKIEDTNEQNITPIVDKEKSLHLQLQELDPELASTLHPNDTRRIKKLLLQLNQEVIYQNFI